MQSYLLEGNKNTDLAKLIFKDKGRNLDIKTHKKQKYEDNLCVGCGVRIETEDEILSFSGLGTDRGLEYSAVFSGLAS